MENCSKVALSYHLPSREEIRRILDNTKDDPSWMMRNLAFNPAVQRCIIDDSVNDMMKDLCIGLSLEAQSLLGNPWLVSEYLLRLPEVSDSREWGIYLDKVTLHNVTDGVYLGRTVAQGGMHDRCKAHRYRIAAARETAPSSRNGLHYPSAAQDDAVNSFESWSESWLYSRKNHCQTTQNNSRTWPKAG